MHTFTHNRIRPVSVREAAEYLTVSKATMYRWIDKGYVKAIRLPGGQFRIPSEEVERMMAPQVQHGDRQ